MWSCTMCVCALTFIIVHLFVQLSVSHLFLYFRLQFVSLCVCFYLPCTLTCVCVCVSVQVFFLCVHVRCQNGLCDLSMMARLKKDTAVFLPSSYLATLPGSLTQPHKSFLLLRVGLPTRRLRPFDSPACVLFNQMIQF